MTILEIVVGIFSFLLFLILYCAGIGCIWYTIISIKKGEIMVNERIYKFEENPIMYLIGIAMGFFLSYIFFVIPTIFLFEDFFKN